MTPSLAVMNELRDFMFERVYLGPAQARHHRARPSRSSAGSWTTTWRHPDELPELVPRHRGGPASPRSADYVAGMTDRFAIATHAAAVRQHRHG